MNFEDRFEWSHNELRMLKYMLEKDGIQFFRYFYKIRESSRLRINWHLFLIEYCLQAVIDRKINRLIINIAPGYLKTELAVINFIARGFAICPNAKFVHSSYSNSLVLDNSSKIKNLLETPQFQELWPMRLRADSKSKALWYNNHGGGLVAASSGGQITGRRAGRMSDEFSGAFVLDDPLKPEDAYSLVKRSGINNRFNNTMRSRLGDESVPFIIIMQRLHDEDLTGFLLRGGSGDVWHHLSIPTLFDYNTINAKYPEDYTHGIPIDINKLLYCLKSGFDYAF